MVFVFVLLPPCRQIAEGVREVGGPIVGGGVPEELGPFVKFLVVVCQGIQDPLAPFFIEHAAIKERSGGIDAVLPGQLRDEVEKDAVLFGLLQASLAAAPFGHFDVKRRVVALVAVKDIARASQFVGLVAEPFPGHLQAVDHMHLRPPTVCLKMIVMDIFPRISPEPAFVR